MPVSYEDISNRELFDLIVKIAGRLDVMEERFNSLENELKFIKSALSAIEYLKVTN